MSCSTAANTHSSLLHEKNWRESPASCWGIPDCDFRRKVTPTAWEATTSTKRFRRKGLSPYGTSWLNKVYRSHHSELRVSEKRCPWLQTIPRPGDSAIVAWSLSSLETLSVFPLQQVSRGRNPTVCPNIRLGSTQSDVHLDPAANCTVIRERSFPS